MALQWGFHHLPLRRQITQWHIHGTWGSDCGLKPRCIATGIVATGNWRCEARNVLPRPGGPGASDALIRARDARSAARPLGKPRRRCAGSSPDSGHSAGRSGERLSPKFRQLAGVLPTDLDSPATAFRARVKSSLTGINAGLRQCQALDQGRPKGAAGRALPVPSPQSGGISHAGTLPSLRQKL